VLSSFLQERQVMNRPDGPLRAKRGAGDQVGVTAQECANAEDFLVTIDHA
jgi:hypothetical protein